MLFLLTVGAETTASLAAGPRAETAGDEGCGVCASSEPWRRAWNLLGVDLMDSVLDGSASVADFTESLLEIGACGCGVLEVSRAGGVCGCGAGEADDGVVVGEEILDGSLMEGALVSSSTFGWSASGCPCLGVILESGAFAWLWVSCAALSLPLASSMVGASKGALSSFAGSGSVAGASTLTTKSAVTSPSPAPVSPSPGA